MVMQCRSRRGSLRDVHNCVFFLKLLVEQCRIAELIAVDQALLRNISAGLLRFRSIFFPSPYLKFRCVDSRVSPLALAAPLLNVGIHKMIFA